MAGYICVKLDNNVCTQWVQHSSVLDSLAITGQQADDISFALLMVFITAYGIRQIMNVILQRRY